MNSELRNKILEKLTDLNLLKDFGHFDDVKWLFDYIEANCLSLGNLCQSIESNLKEIRRSNSKSLPLTKANLHEIEFYREKTRRDDENTAEIMELINEAIVNCPHGETKLLSRLFYLRATELSENEKYSECLDNINFALRIFPCRKYVLYKAYYLKKLNRLGEAFQLLKSILSDDVKSLIKQCQDPSEFSNFIRKELDRKLDGDTIDNLDFNYFQIEVPPQEKFEEENFVIDPRLTLTSAESKGRFFVANDFIEQNTVVFKEKAFSTILLSAGLRKQCLYCFQSVENKFWPCSGCNEVVFCGPNCAERGLVFSHQRECQLTKFWLNRSKSTFHMFKLLNRFGLTSLLSLERQDDDDLQTYEIETYLHDREQRTKPEEKKDAELKMNAYRAQKRLMSHTEKFSNDYTIHHISSAIECALVAAIVQGYDIKNMDRGDLYRLIEMTFTGIRRILINSFRWSENDEEKEERVHLGTCFCLIASLYNHRCDYNTEWYFENSVIYLKTHKPVAKNEEISICYGCNYQSSFEDRYKQNQSYFFQCNCQICLDDVSLVLSLQCLHCSGPVVICPSVYDASNGQNARCLLCSSVYEDTEKVSAQVSELQRQINLLTKLFSSGIDKARYMPILVERLDMLSKLLYSRGIILVEEITKCCKVFSEENALHECFKYGRIVDQILPLFDGENLDIDSSKNRGILKYCFENLDKQIDLMIFWSDLFRRYYRATESSEQESNKILNLMERFYERFFNLINLMIEDKTTKLGNETDDEEEEEDQAEQEDDTPAKTDFINVGLKQEIKLLRILHSYKRAELANVKNPLDAPKPIINIDDLEF